MRKTFRDILDPDRRLERKRIYTRQIIRALGGVAAMTFAALLNPLAAPRFAKIFGRAASIERQRLTQALKRLERRGLVRRKKRDDGNEYLLLTESGKAEFLREKHRALSIIRPKNWDGRWRVVIFDIREDKKTARDAIRRHLREMGFCCLQKSVFVTPWPCEDEIAFLQTFYESDNEVSMLLAISLGKQERAVRKFFHLAAR